MSRTVSRSMIDGWEKWVDGPKGRITYTNYDDESDQTSLIVQKTVAGVALALTTFVPALRRASTFELGEYRAGDMRMMAIVQKVLTMPGSLLGVGTLEAMMSQLAVSEAKARHCVIEGQVNIQKDLYITLGLGMAASVQAAVQTGVVAAPRPVKPAGVEAEGKEDLDVTNGVRLGDSW